MWIHGPKISSKLAKLQAQVPALRWIITFLGHIIGFLTKIIFKPPRTGSIMWFKMNADEDRKVMNSQSASWLIQGQVVFCPISTHRLIPSSCGFPYQQKEKSKGRRRHISIGYASTVLKIHDSWLLIMSHKKTWGYALLGNPNLTKAFGKKDLATWDMHIHLPFFPFMHFFLYWKVQKVQSAVTFSH